MEPNYIMIRGFNFVEFELIKINKRCFYYPVTYKTKQHKIPHILLIAEYSVYFNREYKFLENWKNYFFRNTKTLWKLFNPADILSGAQGQYCSKQFTCAPLRYLISWVQPL
jgi:glucan phosphoethanolaminetransferase (alkaline phosphatase superfamily)